MIVTALQEHWQRANALFNPPITNDQRTIHGKLKNLWQKAGQVVLGQGKLKDKDRFTEKLDTLVDILNCKCKIVLCVDFQCGDDCGDEAHIQCKCQKEQKMPGLDLAFIKAQRDKIGSPGAYQMGTPDHPETRRQENAAKKKKRKREKNWKGES